MVTRINFSFVLVSILVVIMLAFVPIARAEHPGEVTTQKREEASDSSIAKLEQMIGILNQLVVLLTEYRTKYGAYPAQTKAPAATPTHTEGDEHDDHSAAPAANTHTEGDEHDDHDEDASAEKKFIIEIEPHMGKTHAHVRYTDRPEAMFFVEANINDEDAIVASLVTKLGLSAEVIREALKYMQ
jgi:hypothetical protein